MTLDTLVEADILATCNALGSEVKGEYHKGAECLDCLKDILRYLKRDGENHEVLRCLGSIRLLQTDLLPILKKYHNDPEIFDFTLRILVSLTIPALLMYKEDLPEDKICRNEYLQLVTYLQSYKVAFTDVDAWKVLFEHLKAMLNMRPLERSADENLVIERIIILVRNVLHVPPDESILKQTDDDISMHDKVLLSLRSAQMDVLLLYMCANQEEHQYCLHLLEIVFLMMREHTAEVLATSNQVRSETEKQKDLQALEAARQREQKLKQRLQTVCKPRFSGVYCIKNMKSLSDNDLISYKYVSNVDDIHFDSNKNARRRPKNRARAPDVDPTRHSTLNIRLFLKNFCQELLKAYNKLMVSVKRELMRKVSEEHDETYYFWAVRYFMQFNRLCDFQAALVSETVSTQTFHHVQTEITNYQEMMLTDKKKQKFWAKRMQLGVGAYKELLETLRKMERSPDEAVKECADALIGHIFYVIEYRELLLSLLSHYDEVKFPLSYLGGLVESTQLFLKMLENHSKKHSEIVVQQKQRKIRRRKKGKKVNNTEVGNEDELLHQQWDEAFGELSEGVRGQKELPTITAFDAASEMTFEEQKVEAVFKIREALIANKPLEALGLLRAARDLWPEQDTFGASDIDPESELNLIKDIHFSNLKRNAEQNSVPITEEASDEEEDEEMASLPPVTEKSLNLDDVYKKYATSKVIMPCSLLLANYRNNKPETNMCLVKLLHRIAWNCKMHAMFFQSTIFLTFQRIFHDPDSSHDPVIKELYRFARFIVQKFFAVAEKNKKIFVELLFWKGAREAYEIEEGYGNSEQKNKGWTEDDEEELKYLYEENKDIHIEGQDVADIILANFNKKCTKPQIISALKRLGLIKSAKDLKPEKRSEWLETEIVDLQHLFEDFKDSEDVMGNIMERLSIKRSRKAVVEKLLELNLIQDRKEVRKRKSKRKPKEGESNGENSSEESDQSSDSAEEEGNSDEDEINFFRNLRAELDNAPDDSEQPSDSLKPVQTAKKAKKPPKVWDEQEVMELILIFNENSDSENLMDIIQEGLTLKRKEKDVIQKLLELGLIKSKNEVKTKKASKLDKSQDTGRKNKKHSEPDNASDSDDLLSSKGVRKSKQSILSDDSSEEGLDSSLQKASGTSEKSFQASKKKRPPKIWDEQEVMDLTSLYHAHQGSKNIMQDILDGLTIKRPKKAVTEKLLELRLIKDKKDLRKKRESKASARKSEGELSSKSLNKRMKKQSAIDSDDSDDVPLSEAIKRTHSSPNRNAENSSEESDKSSDSAEEAGNSDEDEINFFRNVRAELDNALEDSEQPSNSFKPVQTAKKAKKPPKVWDEQEVMELILIFNENSDSDNLMDIIQEGLTLKRKEKDVIQKLLELGLIKSKNEVKTKKASKLDKSQDIGSKNKKHSEPDNASDSDDLVSSKGVRKSKKSILSDDSSEEGLDSSLRKASGTSEKSFQASKKKRPPKIWDEQEVMDLTSLYHAHQGSKSIMQDILDGLTIKRPKKAVTEKLLELRLIKDKKELRKKRESKVSARKSEGELTSKSLNKRMKKQSAIDSDDSDDVPLSEAIKRTHSSPNSKPSNEWDELEIMELHGLFNENQDSSDILDAISKGLTVKRPKPAIVSKLIELALIKSKKEVMKKREQKSKREKTGDLSNDPNSIQKSETSGDLDNELNSSPVPRKSKISQIFSESSDDDETSVLKSKDYSFTKDSAFLSSLEPPLKTAVRRRKKNRATISSDEEENLTNSQDDHDSYSDKNRTEETLTKSHIRKINHRTGLAGSSDDDILTEDQNEHSMSKTDNIKDDIDLQNFKSHPNRDLEKKNNFRQRLLLDSSDEDERETLKKTEDNQELQSGKRKRTVISSGDSSDENSKEPITVQGGEENSKVLTLAKAKAKKRFVLEDSGDSS